MKKGKTKVTNFLFKKNVINNDKLAVTPENKNVIKNIYRCNIITVAHKINQPTYTQDIC